MRNILALTILLGLISCSNHSEISISSSKQQFDSIPIWILVAESNYILRTNINLPLHDIDTMFQNDNFDYITLELSRNDLFKGKFKGDTIIAKMFVGNFKKEILDSLDNKDCIVFLSDISRVIGVNDLYINYISDNSSVKSNMVNAECETQNKIFKDFSMYSMDTVFYGENTIIGLIENLVNPSAKYNTIDTLGKIDSTYYPAIIKYMDDYRPIKEKYIYFKNDEGFWEDYRHYSPDKVMDYLAAISNNLSGYSFGNIYNGEINDMIRHDTYQSWIVWLYNKYGINTIKKR